MHTEHCLCHIMQVWNSLSQGNTWLRSLGKDSEMDEAFLTAYYQQPVITNKKKDFLE